MPFLDRSDAGRRLAGRLVRLRGAEGAEVTEVTVLGLPRGGIPVAFEIARALGAALDVIVVRKLGLPVQPELAMGAIGEDGIRIVNWEVVRAEQVSEAEFAEVEARERVELSRRARRFRGDRPRVPLAGRTAVVVDDGMATGSTARAACRVARAQGAARVVLAVPVAPGQVLAELADVADEVVCLEAPEPFYAIGQWYRDFTQTPDAEVVSLLRLAAEPPAAAPAPATGQQDRGPAAEVAEVVVAADGVRLAGEFTMPPGAAGIVVFAHGSGSSRHSPRNRSVAATLNEAGLGTLLFDLLTRDEELDRPNVFDIDLLASRLASATRWLRARPGAGDARLGYFGASTGAAAALWAAAEPGSEISAVVSRGGRPDLAGPRLAMVRAPTLLIVGGQDDLVLELNRQAEAQLTSAARLAVVPGATHLFEEPGTLAQAAALARDWFLSYLTPLRTGASGHVPGHPRGWVHDRGG